LSSFLHPAHGNALLVLLLWITLLWLAAAVAAVFITAQEVAVAQAVFLRELLYL
jgi:hypothetical protein